MTELPPPVLTETGSYENWRNEIQMWQITTTMEPKRQALAVRTKLSGKVREVALKLDAADLNNDNGMSFLIDALDANFRKKPKKWDVPHSSAKQNSKDNGQSVVKDDKQSDKSVNLSATDKAKQRVAELNAKLTAEGKCIATGKTPEPPPSSFTPALLPGQSGTNQSVLPEVKKMGNGNSIAEFVINDVSARPFLTRLSTRDLIAQKSGTTVSLRGRFLSEEDKKRNVINGVVEKPLVLVIQANVAAKVQVALHKITEVCRIYETVGAENNFNNYGLSANTEPSNHHYIQHKLWVGLDHVHPDFNLKLKLAGENGTNFTFMVQQTGAKVFLRGKGSGYMEPNSGRESFEALHIYISHPRQDGLDMAHQLCESLIETVKAQYDEWNAQRIAQPTNPSFRPPCVEQINLPYPAYPPPSNGGNAPYGSIPSHMNNEVPVSGAMSLRHEEEHRALASTSSRVSENSTLTTVMDYRETPGNSVPAHVLDYRQMYPQTPVSVVGPRPYASKPFASVNEERPPESDFIADDMSSGNFEERFHQHSRDHSANEQEQFEEMNNHDRKFDRSSRRRARNHEKQNENEGKTPVRSPSPELRKSHSRESKSKSKNNYQEAQNHKESSPVLRLSPPSRRDCSPPRRYSPEQDTLSGRRSSPTRCRDSSPRRRDSSPRRRDLSPRRRDSPSNHRNSSPGRQDSAHNRRDDAQRRDGTFGLQDKLTTRVDSPINIVDLLPDRRRSPSPLPRRDSPPKERIQKKSSPPTECIQKKESPPKERTKRKFTEAPKKKRKFSEDPRLIEQAKVQLLLADENKQKKDVEQSVSAASNLELLNEKRPPPKLQFRAKKEPSQSNQTKSILKQPKSILKMAPPTNLPLAPKRNGVPKSVKISPAGIIRKSTNMEKDDPIFKAPPPIEMLKPPQAPQQKVLKMGALSSLSMYDDDDSDDD